MRNCGLYELQAGIKIGGKNINSRYADDITLMAENEEELEKFLMRVKEESEKAGLNKTKVMASCPITSWQIEGEKVEVGTDFLFLGSKITAHGDCGHVIRQWLLLGRKTLTNLDSVFKSRDISLLTEVHIIKAVVFPLVTYSFESWPVKKGEHWRIDAFNCGVGKSPESPLDSKEIKPVNTKGNQPWILIGRTLAEAPVFWSPDVNSWLFGKIPDTGKDWRQKEKRASEDEMTGWHHWCNGHELEQTSGDGEGKGGLVWCSPWGCKESDMTGQLNKKKYVYVNPNLPFIPFHFAPGNRVCFLHL